MQKNHVFIAQDATFKLQPKPKTLINIGVKKKGLTRNALSKNHNIFIRDGKAEYLKIQGKQESIEIKSGDIWCRVKKDNNNPEIAVILYITVGKGFNQVELHPDNDFLKLVATLIKQHM
jgi:hypothetical protein